MNTYVNPIGIDLGTTRCCVYTYVNNKFVCIPNEFGNRTTPSIVSFTDDKIIVGDEALNKLKSNVKNTVYDIKRIIGRTYDDTSLKSNLMHWGFKVVSDDNKPMILINDKKYSPEQITSFILIKLKEIAENFLGTEIRNVVVTIPAYFNDCQRQATKLAGHMAGLNIMRMINEPTAAALSYGFQNNLDCLNRHVVIFDFGGGTLDVSLLQCENDIYTVLATSGNSSLGGDDFDKQIVKWFFFEFSKKNKNINIIEVIKNEKTLIKVKIEAEKCKISLSRNIVSNMIVENMHGDIDFSCELTRAKFEEICFQCINWAIEPLEDVISQKKIKKNMIDDIVLVGGSSRIPIIVNNVKKFFNLDSNNDHKLKMNINPDEAIAYGACVQASILLKIDNEKFDSLVLIDVIPLSLGIKTNGGIMKKIIHRNNSIPCTKKETFTTFVDNQPSVTICIYEGERELADKNNLLGKFELVNLPLMPRGTIRISVTFKIDSNGILNVSAIEESSKIQNKIDILKDFQINDDNDLKYIDNALQDANDYKNIDDDIKKSILAYNYLNYYTITVEDNLKNDPQYLELSNEQIDKIKKEINHLQIFLTNVKKEEYDIFIRKFNYDHCIRMKNNASKIIQNELDSIINNYQNDN